MSFNREKIIEYDLASAVEKVSLDGSDSSILNHDFIIWLSCEFLDAEDILSLRQVSYFTREHSPNIKRIVENRVSDESDNLKRVYEHSDVMSLNTSSTLLLVQLPFIKQIFTIPKKGNLCAKEFLRELENCKHQNDEQKCLCRTAAGVFRTHYFQKYKTFRNYDSPESSFVTSVAMHLYH